MKQKTLTDLTDQELLQEVKKRKSASIINAVLVGFLIGIVLYSVFMNGWGFLALILLFVVYKLVNNSKHSAGELEKILKDRGLQ